MTRQERRAWVARGRPDPVKAYRAHAASAAERQIEFRLTFAQWWILWEPHYEDRGRAIEQKCMCRKGDKGAYELGNVRIDTVRSNIGERVTTQRAAVLQTGRVPTGERMAVVYGQADWLFRDPFRPYVEPEDG